MNTLVAAEWARLDPLGRTPGLDLARIKAAQIAAEMGGWAPRALRTMGLKAPYHIADIVDNIGAPMWARYWPEAARVAFVGALVGTPEVTREMAQRFHTRAKPAVTADMCPWDAWGCWGAYQDTICDAEEYTAHTARRVNALRAAVAALRAGVQG